MAQICKLKILTSFTVHMVMINNNLFVPKISTNTLKNTSAAKNNNKSENVAYTTNPNIFRSYINFTGNAPAVKKA